MKRKNVTHAERLAWDREYGSGTGRFGAVGLKRYRHLWQRVRLKRSKRRGPSPPGAECGPIRVQRYGPPRGRGRRRWVTIGEYTTEDEAVEAMEVEVEQMKLAEEMKELGGELRMKDQELPITI